MYIYINNICRSNRNKGKTVEGTIMPLWGLMHDYIPLPTPSKENSTPPDRLGDYSLPIHGDINMSTIANPKTIPELSLSC